MKRQQIHAWIRYDDYVNLRQNEENISKLICDLVNAYLSNKYKKSSKDELLVQKEKYQNEVSKYSEKLGMINMQLLELKRKEEEEEDEETKERIKTAQAIRDSGILADMIK